jgi:hypothetical protein
LRIGDVTVDEQGQSFVAGLDSMGAPIWICLDDIDESVRPVVISILKTIRSACTAPVDSHANLKSPPVKPRKHSAYNDHVSHMLRRLAQIRPDMGRRERMRLAVATWLELAKTAHNDAEKRKMSDDAVARLRPLDLCGLDTPKTPSPPSPPRHLGICILGIA